MGNPSTITLLCFSDLHLDVAAAKRLAGRAMAGGIDLLVSAGDLGLDGTHDLEVHRALNRPGVPVLAIPGNHDGNRRYERTIEEAGWTSIDRRVHPLGDFFVAGYGIRALPDDEELEYDRFHALTRLLDAVPQDRLVVVSHLPPAGTLSARSRFIDFGSRPLAEWVRRRQPAAVVCGHVHQHEAVVERLGTTLVVNPGPYGWSLRLPVH